MNKPDKIYISYKTFCFDKWIGGTWRFEADPTAHIDEYVSKEYLDNALKAQRLACANAYCPDYGASMPVDVYHKRQAILNARIEE